MKPSNVNTPREPGKRPTFARRSISAGLTLALCLGFTGCSALRPVEVVERHFVLSPLPDEAAAPAASVSPRGPTVGVGPLRVAAYLSRDAFVVRRGRHEIQYLESMRWAERVDRGVQRVFEANLGMLLPDAVIRSTSWRPGDVAVEVQIQLEQLDVDLAGNGVLEAAWRIIAHDREGAVRHGRSRHTVSGPRPSVDPDGAVATLSLLVGTLSRDVAAAVLGDARFEPDGSGRAGRADLP
ncbi:MAG TPA: PqiC family protein [Candidatus Paceibacterota bacterium]|nr:PqiC family protein [Candidatus Paceibacterota bacterium]